MTTGLKEKKYGTTPGFVVIRADVGQEELILLKQVQLETSRSQKELLRSAIRWLPKSDRPIEYEKKRGGKKQMSLEVTEEEKNIVKAIALTNKITITDTIRWIISNLDWIAKEI